MEGIFGLPPAEMEAAMYNVGRRKHEPKGQSAREVVDFPFRIKVKCLDLRECAIFSSLYDLYDDDQQLLNIEGLDPADMYVKSELAEGSYDTLTAKDFSILVDRGSKHQRLHCAHGITLRTARVLADEGDGVSSINPPCLLTLTAKGVPLEQAMKWNGKICEWLLKPKNIQFVSKDAAEVLIEAEETIAVQKARAEKAAKKSQAKRAKSEGQLGIEGAYVPSVQQLQGLTSETKLVIGMAGCEPKAPDKFLKDDEDLWIGQGSVKGVMYTSKQLLDAYPKGIATIKAAKPKLLPAWTETVSG